MKGNRFVEIVGHSDPVCSAAAKQSVSDERAKNVRRELENLGMDNVQPTKTAANAPRVTRVEGVADREPLAGEPHSEWRRVEIVTTSFPAAHAKGDACAKLLIDEAWAGLI